MNQELEVEVFRAGDYGPKGVWDERQLDQMVADYDPALHEAPVTLDHEQRGPALGWVESLRRAGDRLVARLRGLNVKLLELIHAGSFKKRSIEIYPALRETGRPYLRAVSFLGAGVPEVKGLADPLLPETGAATLFDETRDGEPSLCFEAEMEAPTRDNAAEQANQGNPGDSAGPQAAAQSGNPPILAFAELAGRLRQRGQWHPAWCDRGIESFYGALAGLPEIESGADARVRPAEWFAAFLESLAPRVALGEAAPALRKQEERSIPQADNVDPASVVMLQAALSFQQSHPGVGYAEALMQACAVR